MKNTILMMLLSLSSVQVAFAGGGSYGGGSYGGGSYGGGSFGGGSFGAGAYGANGLTETVFQHPYIYISLLVLAAFVLVAMKRKQIQK